MQRGLQRALYDFLCTPEATVYKNPEDHITAISPPPVKPPLVLKLYWCKQKLCCYSCLYRRTNKYPVIPQFLKWFWLEPIIWFPTSFMQTEKRNNFNLFMTKRKQKIFISYDRDCCVQTRSSRTLGEATVASHNTYAPHLLSAFHHIPFNYYFIKIHTLKSNKA